MNQAHDWIEARIALQLASKAAVRSPSSGLTSSIPSPVNIPASTSPSAKRCWWAFTYAG